MPPSGKILEVGLRPLKDIYFAGVIGYHKLGDRKNTFIFMIIAGFVLLIAAINFINLTTAQAARRSKETGLRKILGADRSRSCNADMCRGSHHNTGISGNCTWNIRIAASLVFGIYQYQSVDTIFCTKPSAAYCHSPLLLGILSALFPAWYLSRVSPLSVLRKEMNTGRKGAGLRTISHHIPVQHQYIPDNRDPCCKQAACAL
jgi:putative ABC transport system permease protein